MRFSELVETSREIGATRSRKAKVALLSALLHALDADERAVGVNFVVGELRQGRIGVGWAALRTVRESAASAASATLGLLDVDRRFAEIATLSGKGSGGRRTALLGALFESATEPEGDFLARLLSGELRQGASAGLVTEAVAVAAEVELSSVRRAAMLSGNLSEVAVAALAGGAPELANFRMELFRPLQPMLAQPAEDLEVALDTLGLAALEFKLDGARIQVHKDGDEVRVFSRSLHDVTVAVPEVVDAAREFLPARAVLDGEAIAIGEGGRPFAFQTTMQRFGRRLDVERMRSELPLSSFYFDCLHLDGTDLIDQPATERAAALAEFIPLAHQVPRLVTRDAHEANAFWQRSLDQGHEGLMAKAVEAPYAAGGRGKAWLKLKPAHTLDLVVLAAEWGSGRRRGWLSNLHLGARDGAGFAMLGKTFKGLTDERLKWQTEALLAREIAREGHVVHVRPELVVEIAFNDVQASPHYPSGFALRFARVKRYRADKSVAEADTLESVRALFEAGAPQR